MHNIKFTEKGTAWQQQLLVTKEYAAKHRHTPAARAAVNAAALVVAYSVASPDKYFSLDSLDTHVSMSHPTVFLTHTLPYRSLAPCI